MAVPPAPPPGPIGPNKAIASVLAGAVITVIVWLVDLIWNVQVPAEVAAGATTIIGTVLVWIVPHGGQ